MKKKTLLSALLAGAMVFSLAACGSKPASTDGSTTTSASASTTSTAASTTSASTASTTSSAEVAETPVEGGQLIIGDSTQSNGDMYPIWTNNSSDYKAYQLSFGYTTVAKDKSGKFIVDPQVVKDVQTTDNSDGTKTYTIKIFEDLKWSNGEQITAKDYVFDVLFFSNPVLVEYGASTVTRGMYYQGFDAYNKGETDVFEGVRLLGDYEFSVTVSKDYLPYYYDLYLMAVMPSYLKGWLPEGFDVVDEGKGAFITGGDLKAKATADHVNAYRMDLKAYSGPYMKDKYDETSNTYTLKRNPEFKGNFEGQKPYIETLLIKHVKSETQFDELKTGSVDLLTFMMDGKEINTGLDLVEAGTHGYTDYMRNGYGQLIFVCDRGPTQFTEVRHAIAYLLDRNEFAKTFTGGYGEVVNGEYGLSQWMVEEKEEEISALNQYSYSIDNAIAELEKAGFTLDKDGKPYKEGLRYKKLDNGDLMPLTINWCSSENNPVSDLLATMLAKSPDVAKAGMEIKQSVVTFNELINNYYQLKENDFNMYNMGQGFTAVFDRQKEYEIGNPANRNRISDEELQKLAADMLKVNNDEDFANRWLAYQQRWNELLPNLPLYSNQIHDFYTIRLKNYTDIKGGLWELVDQILYCWVVD